MKSFRPLRSPWKQSTALSGPHPRCDPRKRAAFSFNLSAEPCTQQTAKADCILFSLKHTHTNTHTPTSTTSPSFWPRFTRLPFTETGNDHSAVFACFYRSFISSYALDSYHNSPAPSRSCDFFFFFFGSHSPDDKKITMV